MLQEKRKQPVSNFSWTPAVCIQGFLGTLSTGRFRFLFPNYFFDSGKQFIIGFISRNVGIFCLDGVGGLE